MTGLSTVVNQYIAQTPSFPLSGGTANLQFNNLCTAYTTHTVAGPINFTANPANRFPGATAIVRLIANGTNAPTFTGFREEFGVYDNRVVEGTGILNVLKFWFDGVDYWVSIYQEPYDPIIIETPSDRDVTFSVRPGNISPSGNDYVATSPAHSTTFMIADQKIPANSAGGFSADYLGSNNVNIIIGLKETDTATGFAANGGYKYYLAVVGGSFVWGINGVAPATNSGVTAQTGDRYRIFREANGTVKAQYSRVSGTWVDILTYVPTSTVDLFLAVNMATTRLDNPFGFGVVDK